MQGDDAAPHESAVQEADGHIDSGTPARDDEVAVERHHGREGAVDAEHGQQQRTVMPLLAGQQYDEVFGDEG